MSIHQDFENDEEEIAKNQGVLAGNAFNEVENIKEKPTREGYEFKCMCNQCAQHAKVVIPWVELITCSAGAVPLDSTSNQQWNVQVDPARGRYMIPSAHCPRCGTQYPIVMYPGKAEKMVDIGVSMGAVTRQQVDQHKAYVQNQMRGYR